jgi:hypothetical protein
VEYPTTAKISVYKEFSEQKSGARSIFYIHFLSTNSVHSAYEPPYNYGHQNVSHQRSY